MSDLTPCPSCQRHLRSDEPLCPFCGARVVHSADASDSGEIGDADDELVLEPQLDFDPFGPTSSPPSSRPSMPAPVYEAPPTDRTLALEGLVYGMPPFARRVPTPPPPPPPVDPHKWDDLLPPEEETETP